MNLLQDISESATGGEVRPANLLRRVKVLAGRETEGVALGTWVEEELTGYPKEAEVPAYRGPFEFGVLGDFQGAFGTGLRNAPNPPVAFPKEVRAGPLFMMELRRSISEIEEFSKSREPLRTMRSADAIALVNSQVAGGEVKLDRDLHLVQAWKCDSEFGVRWNRRFGGIARS